MHRQILTSVCAILGSTIEYYNYMLFMFLIPLWGSELFPPESSILEKGYMLILLAALTRPFAAMLIGRIGDRIGRRSALFFCACIMSLACIVMSYLPSYSPNSFMEKYKITLTLVFICRILENASAAGKLNGSAIYLLEHFSKYSGLMSGLIWSATIAGMCLAAFAESFCVIEPRRWRLMMRIGASAAILGFIMIVYLQESEEFTKSKTYPVKTDDKNMFFGKFSVFCMGSSIGGMFYYLSNYVPIHFQKIASISNIGTERSYLLITYAISAFLGGLLSDEYQGKREKRVRLIVSYLLLLMIISLIRFNMSKMIWAEQILTFLTVLITSIGNQKLFILLKYLNLTRCILAFNLYSPIEAMIVCIPTICFMCHRAALWSIILLVLFSFPVMHYITVNQTLTPNFALMLLAGIFVGPSHRIMNDMFPPNKRYTSISLFYGIGTAIMGGASTYVCLKLSKINLFYPAFYMVFVSFLGLLALIAGHIHRNSAGNGNI